MAFRLFQRRTIWLPTLPGWLSLIALACAAFAIWIFRGESFLAVTDRCAADVLVVEGWIGATAVKDAGIEYQMGGYQVIVAAGGLTGERWNDRRWSYATEVEEQLLHLGIPRDRVIRAASQETEVQRTFEMAVATRRSLLDAGLHPAAINVFTRGPHARRSRLIFQKVFGSKTNVGIISWKPADFHHESWWQGSDRAEDMIKETVGYTFELLLNSGRGSKSMLMPHSVASTSEPPVKSTINEKSVADAVP